MDADEKNSDCETQQVCEFDSFAEFENFVSKKDLEKNDTWKPLVVEGPLYRGHADPRWKIESTLDRAIDNCSVSDYYNSIYKAYFEISGVAGQTWSLEDIMSIRNQCAKFENWPGIPNKLPNPEYLTYLRHYGFPSPLVDWSRSPYVAAFFAYRYPTSSKHEKVSIFMMDNKNKDLARPIVQSNNSDHVIQIGRHIATDRRHFIQQSDYTSCLRYKNQKWEFCSHEDFLLSASSANIEVCKCILPSKEREHVLRRLDQMNINAFSLFGSIESLMETTSRRFPGQF